MAGQTIFLTRQEIAEQIEIAEAVPAIERALGEFEKGNDYLPPKGIFEVPVGPAWAACIVGYTQTTNLLSMKVGQERSDNAKRNLPTTNSWLLVFEPTTGELLMICDGTLPTMYRTAAAAAVGAKHLARGDATILTVIGAGQLGRQCLRAVSTVRPFEKVFLHDMDESAVRRVADELASQVEVSIEVVDAETACRSAHVIVTATNSRQPIVQSDWIALGTHLSCMGSDLSDKIECEMTLLPRCRIFADMIEHAIARGEVSQAVANGVLRQEPYAGSLGQVINGDVPGRTNDDQITMFDGVGIGIQDTTIGRTIYDQALAKELGTRMAFS